MVLAITGSSKCIFKALSGSPWSSRWVESGKQPLKSSSKLPLPCGSGFKSQDYNMWKNEKEERRVEVSFVDDKRKAPSGR